MASPSTKVRIQLLQQLVDRGFALHIKRATADPPKDILVLDSILCILLPRSLLFLNGRAHTATAYGQLDF